MIRSVEIAALAPTGEGVARSQDGVGFVEGALPGEEVDAEVIETRSRFWRGRTIAVRSASPDRVTGPHVPCAACDWAHISPAAALSAKRGLFLETMKRIGGLESEPFGELPARPSPPGYRIRNRFHAVGRGSGTAVGWFSRRSHDVFPAEACEMLTPTMRERLALLRSALAESGGGTCEIATLESRDLAHRAVEVSREPGKPADRSASRALAQALAPAFDGVRVMGGGAPSTRVGSTSLDIEVEGRVFTASPRTFFQGNRFLVADLYRDVRDLAGGLPAGRTLDAFGGVGLFAGALLDAGHHVVSVEADAAASRAAARTRRLWGAETRWDLLDSDVDPYVRRHAGSGPPFDLIVADPPRAGLGKPLATALARMARTRLLYVSCNPATLARDLPAILAEGFRIADARLYDLYLFTHRIEAVIALERTAAA